MGLLGDVLALDTTAINNIGYNEVRRTSELRALRFDWSSLQVHGQLEAVRESHIECNSFD